MAQSKNMESSNSFENALKVSGKRSAGVFNLKRTYPAFITLLIGILISFGIYKYMENKVAEDRKDAFDEATEAVQSRISERYNTFEDIVANLRSLYDNSFVVRDIFESNARVPIESFPAINGIFKTYEFEDLIREETIFNMQREGFYDFSIKPEGIRKEYEVVEFFSPFQRNYDISGLDIKTDSVLANVVEKAKLSGKYVNSPAYYFREDTLSFFIISPIYEAGAPIENEEDKITFYEGSILLELNVESFFEGALGAQVATDSTIIFRIYNSGSENDVIYESKNSSLLDSEYNIFIEEERNIPLSDREFSVRYYTVPGFGGTFQSILPILSLVLSLVISFALFGFILSVLTSRARAEDLADKMTRSQRRIMDASMDVIAVLGFDGEWKSMNQASQRMFDAVPEEMIGKNIKSLIIVDSDKSHFDNIKSQVDNYTDRVDFRMATDRGDEKWVNWSFTVSKDDNLIYAIGRDVTLEKEQAKLQQIKSKQIELAERYALESSESTSYFMTKLSHKFRNSLTGMMGYLQLIASKSYENEEEMESYAHMAKDSSEELYNYVNDLIDASESKEEERGHSFNIETIILGNSIKRVQDNLDKSIPDVKVEINMMDESDRARLVADKTLLDQSLIQAISIMSDGLSNGKFDINAVTNPYEGATEIQIMCPPNDVAEKMINIYKKESSSIIEALAKDEDNILFGLAILASNFRRMDGSVQFEAFGGDEGNVIMMTLPYDKKDPSKIS
ncbi:MAG: hypothetical protein Kapaf2KO_07580 [Candidatus Kapaibacteriales bacterium]